MYMYKKPVEIKYIGALAKYSNVVVTCLKLSILLTTRREEIIFGLFLQTKTEIAK